MSEDFLRRLRADTLTKIDDWQSVQTRQSKSPALEADLSDQAEWQSWELAPEWTSAGQAQQACEAASERVRANLLQTAFDRLDRQKM